MSGERLTVELNQQFADELKQWMVLAKERNSDENERLRDALEHIVEIYEHHVKTYDHVPSNVYLMAKIARAALKEKE